MNSKFPVTATISYTNKLPRMVANVFVNYFSYFFCPQGAFSKNNIETLINLTCLKYLSNQSNSNSLFNYQII